MYSQLQEIQKKRPIKELIENRTVFGGENTELSIYDTYQRAERVSFITSDMTFCAMVSGKKIVRYSDTESVDFLPNESGFISSNTAFLIDFPVATSAQPTQCITIKIAKEKMEEIWGRLNEKSQIFGDSGKRKEVGLDFLLLQNSVVIEQVIERLIGLFLENAPARDMLIDYNIYELMIRMLQGKARNTFLNFTGNRIADHQLAAAIQYIKRNINQKIPIKKLASVSGMSTANFYRYFQHEFGLTPIQYINQERIRIACNMLKKRSLSVTEVCFMVGFFNVSHFINTFKLHKGITPKQYQKKYYPLQKLDKRNVNRQGLD